MKKLLSISLVAALAVTPLMAFAGAQDDSGSCTEAGGRWDSTAAVGSQCILPFRVAAADHTADTTKAASGAYVKGAYNANVGNINTALEYVEDSTVATINTAKVSAQDVSLSVTGFTPSGSVTVDSSTATINGSVNVPTTVEVYSTWGGTSTQTASLGGSTATNINAGATVSGISASFSGNASGNLSGTGSFSNASVSVTDWVPVAPSAGE